MQRQLLHRSEDKISYLQIIGFSVILSAILYLFFEQVFGILTGEIVAIGFFMIMLGVSFAFPDLLQDGNNGLSTMRIVVFMMVNVICMLLLKMGWANLSLKGIGLDQYWMGVIAFIFGAKATQSYFESKLAAPPAAQNAAANDEALDGCGITPLTYTSDDALPVAEGGIAK